MEKNKVKKRNTVYTIYSAFSGDLLFYIAVSVLFFTYVKGLTASQITFLTTISVLINVIFQIPLINVIKKIGNLNSVRLGAILLFMSSILITFGTKYITFIIALTLYEISYVFNNMGDIILKGNLKYINQENKFISIKSKINILYSVITAVIALIAGPLFNINGYLPMICCILNCIFCIILSFFIVDVNKDKVTSRKNNKIDIEKNAKVTIVRLAVILFIVYGIFYGIIKVGQDNGSLFIKDELSKYYSSTNVATIFTSIIFISRVIRIIGNVVYKKIYNKLNDKSVPIILALLVLSLVALITSSFISNIAIKIVIMTFGFCIILFVRDPIKIYMQDYILKNFDSSKHQKYLTYLNFARKVGMTITSGIISLILTKYSLVYALFVLLLICIVNFVAIKILEQEENASESINVEENISQEAV